jgi:dolichol kinase
MARDSDPTEAVANQGNPSTFKELVDKTGGQQPWRRLFHALNGIAIAVVWTSLDLQRPTAIGILAVGFLCLLILDLARLRNPRTNEIFFRTFTVLASPREATRLASSTWYTLGVLLAVAFFSRELAICGILVLALADPAAGYGGRRWGQRPFLGGTMEGSVIFALVAVAVLWVFFPIWIAVLAGLATAVAERLSWPLDDNLTIPVACAGTLMVLESLV